MATSAICSTTPTIQAQQIPPNAYAQTGSLRTIGILDINIADVAHYECGPEHEQLKESIRNSGIQEPLVVRAAKRTKKEPKQRYELLDGRARWCCALALHLREIPVNVVEMSEYESSQIRHRKSAWSLIEKVFGFQSADQSEFPDYGLRRIAEKIEFRKCRLPYEAKYLDEVAHGRKSKRHIEKAKDSTYYIDELYASTGWWTRIIYEASIGRNRRRPPKELYEEMNDVFCCFAGVYRESHVYELDGHRTLELLKRYRIFTRSVCSFAQEVLPDMNLQALLDQV
jgi:hypothetical protein